MNNLKLSFMGANLVAQQLGWHMSEGWGQGDAAANAYYRSVDTFEERFTEFARLALDAGFDIVDVWTAQVNWDWATSAHLDAAVRVLDEVGLTVASYAGGFGSTAAELKAACRVASRLGTSILGGNCAALLSDRAGVLAVLREAGCVLAIENHPEKRPQEILDLIGEDVDVLATAVDTGWWGTQGCDAAAAIRELGPHVRHVHLKDIRAVGAHDTCALGDGVVPIRECLAAIDEIGYSGPLAIEHEPETYDPMPEVIESRRRIIEWRSETATA